MAGTKEGGAKAASTNKLRYGTDFYRQIGRMGGRLSTGGGFAADRNFASAMGRKGGLASRRTKKII